MARLLNFNQIIGLKQRYNTASITAL